MCKLSILLAEFTIVNESAGYVTIIMLFSAVFIYELYLSCQVTGSYWLAHPKLQLCDYCGDIIIHIDT